MSEHHPPVDHFSNEAINTYTELLRTRGELAQRSIASRKLIFLETDWLHYDSPQLVAYRHALGSTVDLYVRGYQLQQYDEHMIKTILLPRIGDEHRLFGEAEATNFWADDNRVDNTSKLYDGLAEDRGHMLWHITEYAIHQPLEEALWGTIHRMSALIVTRSDTDRA